MRTTGKAGQAYHDIEKMIVFGDIEPGSLVSEALLMEKTGFGRTPVREALQWLSRNRMVEIHPNKGVLIPHASVEAQLRMLELRRVLESLAVRLACERSSFSDREAMESMVARLSTVPLELREYAETVRGTHDLIVAGAHNAYLADAMAPLQGLSRRFWFTHVRNVESEIGTGAGLHAAILRSILERDADTAEENSLLLNDYLVDFAYGVLGGRPST